MCILTKYVDDDSIDGYKIVAMKRDTGKFYSLAMGFQYNSNEDVPIVEDQFRIGNYFVDSILASGLFKINMRGRSAIFAHLQDAKDIYVEMKGHLQRFEQTYVLCLVEATVSKRIMKGIYGMSDRAVYAGERIAINKIMFKED